MRTTEHPDANATASELTGFLDGPVQPGDVDAMLKALRSAVPVAQPNPRSSTFAPASGPTENASDFPASRESCKPSAGACAQSGTLPFLLAADHAFHAASSSRFNGYGVPHHSFTTA